MDLSNEDSQAKLAAAKLGPTLRFIGQVSFLITSSTGVFFWISFGARFSPSFVSATSRPNHCHNYVRSFPFVLKFTQLTNKTGIHTAFSDVRPMTGEPVESVSTDLPQPPTGGSLDDLTSDRRCESRCDLRIRSVPCDHRVHRVSTRCAWHTEKGLIMRT